MLNSELAALREEGRYLNVYIVDRAYGGPEEGGWWYDYGVPYASVPLGEDDGPAYHQPAVQKAAWKRWVKASNEDRPQVSSVSSEGIYVIRFEQGMAAAWPTERPYYE